MKEHLATIALLLAIALTAHRVIISTVAVLTMYVRLDGKAKTVVLVCINVVSPCLVAVC